MIAGRMPFAPDRAQPDYDEAWADFPKAQLPK
jgi:hypothetical protein